MRIISFSLKQYFFLSRSGYLRDTSTSGKGYCRVTMPIDQYTKYEYTFDTMDVSFQKFENLLVYELKLWDFLSKKMFI